VTLVTIAMHVCTNPELASVANDMMYLSVDVSGGLALGLPTTAPCVITECASYATWPGTMSSRIGPDKCLIHQGSDGLVQKSKQATTAHWL
jgi:hypothetical protein